MRQLHMLKVPPYKKPQRNRKIQPTAKINMVSFVLIPWNSNSSVHKVLREHGHALLYSLPLAALTPEGQSWAFVTRDHTQASSHPALQLGYELQARVWHNSAPSAICCTAVLYYFQCTPNMSKQEKKIWTSNVVFLRYNGIWTILLWD